MTFGTVLSAAMLLFIAVGFFYTPYDPAALSLKDKLGAPSLTHPFGCDTLGRDVLSRTLDGAGTTLIIALAVLAVGFLFGLVIGALCGYYGGLADAVIMRICDAITAFPSILLAMVVIAITGDGLGQNAYIDLELDSGVVTHRIIDMQIDESGQRWVTTQGDANNAPDDPIPYENIIGRVVCHIPNVGYFKHFLQTPLGFLTLTLLAAAALVSPDWIAKAVDKGRKEKK